jgi:Putative prokaryotic signal transducing protein
MFENWVVIFTTDQLYEAELVRNFLYDHGIECVIMNKKDSAYMFGDIEVYVPTEEAFRAKQLILDFKSE